MHGLQFNRLNTKGENILVFRPKSAGDLRITIEAEVRENDPFNFQTPLKCKVYQRFEASRDQIAFVDALIEHRRMIGVSDSIRLPLVKHGRTCIGSDGCLVDGFFPCRHECPREIECEINHVENLLVGHLERFLKLMRWRQNCDSGSKIINHTSLYWNTGQSLFHLVPLIGRRSDYSTRCSVGFSHEVEDLRDLENLWGEISLTEPLGHALLREARSVCEDSALSAWLIMTAGLETAIKTTISRIAPDTNWLMEEVSAPPIKKLLKDYLPEICEKRGISLDFWPSLKGHFKKLESIVTVRNKIAHTGRLPSDAVSLGEAMEIAEDILYILDVVNGHEWAKCFLSYPLREKLGWPEPRHRRMFVTIEATD